MALIRQNSQPIYCDIGDYINLILLLKYILIYFVFQYKGEAQSQLKEHYNQHTMEAAFKKTAPKNLAFYLAAMGSAAGSAGYPSWSSTSSQSIVPNRPQATGWSMPPGFSYYEYNPSAFTSSTANNTGHDISLEIKDDEPANNRSSLYTAIGHNANQ